MAQLYSRVAKLLSPVCHCIDLSPDPRAYLAATPWIAQILDPMRRLRTSRYRRSSRPELPRYVTTDEYGDLARFETADLVVASTVELDGEPMQVLRGVSAGSPEIGPVQPPSAEFVRAVLVEDVQEVAEVDKVLHGEPIGIRVRLQDDS